MNKALVEFRQLEEEALLAIEASPDEYFEKSIEVEVPTHYTKAFISAITSEHSSMHTKSCTRECFMIVHVSSGGKFEITLKYHQLISCVIN